MDNSNLPNISSAHIPVEAMPLSWGKSYLMCPPDYFGVFYEINPWMHQEDRPDFDLAMEQWQNLAANLRRAGATVEIIEPVKGLPDMVFVANAGLVDGGRMILSSFRHPERQPESIYTSHWFQARGAEVAELTGEDDLYFEGCGDAFPYGNCLLAAYGFRSSRSSHLALSRLLGIPVHSIRLVDERFYHLDISFSPLDSRHAIVNPAAWDRASNAIIAEVVPEPLVLELDEALTFCANCVVVNKVVIMPACPPRVGRILERWGYDVCVLPVGEFLKAGGAVRCLTLPLDMTISLAELHL
ncbi:MAG TPA: arginine deiminase-related protein [Ktedonobacteraceae bacterium]|jgi:N-dimethylarginine dimethylaminohydrolase|nr:arginine deiminase-related protein [Ktedonobacteraceae bacterium]